MNQAQAKALKQLQIPLKIIERLLSSGTDILNVFEKEMVPDLDSRLRDMAAAIGIDEVDSFGLDPAALRRTVLGSTLLYRYYFRCKTTGVENVPDGPVILVANHGGQLPIDGLMITTALLIERSKPRLARTMMDNWVPTLPFISTFFSRMGVVLGTSDNAHRLLAEDTVLLTFPEGMAGITKTIDQAYQLEKFSLGFMRLALYTNVPIVPVAVVGSEEQYPTLYNLKNVAKVLGLPALPIWPQMIIPMLGLLPLPVKYHIDFGKPMFFDGDPDDRDAVINKQVQQVKAHIKNQIDHLRTKRKSVFL